MNEDFKICIRFVDEKAVAGDLEAQELLFPRKATKQAAGLDLVAANSTPILLSPGSRELIPTGFALELPAGFEAQIRPRSGLALRHGITVLNSPGTVDADYRGQIFVLLVNQGEKEFEITRGMRVAQLVICKLPRVSMFASVTLSSTLRQEDGFGSTGIM